MGDHAVNEELDPEAEQLDTEADDLQELEPYELDGLDDIPDFGLESGLFRALGVEVDAEDDDDIGPDTSPWAGFTGSVKVPTPFDRINEVQIVLGLLHQFMKSSSAVEKLRAELSGIGERVARAVTLDDGSDERDEIDSEIDESLEDLEQRVVALERRVPGSWLRRQFDGQEIDESILAHYLRFQLEHMDATPECWSRIDLIVTRLTRRKIRDDYYLPRQPERLVDLFNRVLPPSTTTSSVRTTAVNFFANASERLQDFAEPEELFSSGFYVDLAGYKISLRLNYFDPVILFAACKTNIALHNWLAAQRSAGRSIDALGSLFAEAHQQIRAVFVNQDQDPESIARFRARMFGKREPERQPQPQRRTEWKAPLEVPPKFSRKLIFAVAFAIALAIVAPTALNMWGTSKRDLSELSPASVQGVHPMLVSASLGGGEPPKLLVGEIDSNQWVVLNRAQKQSETEVLQTGMRGVGVTSALIYREGTVAIHIVDGRLRVLE